MKTLITTTLRYITVQGSVFDLYEEISDARKHNDLFIGAFEIITLPDGTTGKRDISIAISHIVEFREIED